MGGVSELNFNTATSIIFYPSFANTNYTMTIGFQCIGQRDNPIIIREKKVDGFTVSNQATPNSNIIYCNWLISGQGAE